ncbi:phenylalanine--tRNA ligase subunit beta [Lentisphaerota bacterium ZTH]|nr:phenylalanine--tRNA ligase subunit beta [Lentisphaerota bacterium]WET06142.1 phenylalanine--tRNA ligase subunit beta [Lentisphaerota bacterium ZTH]
MKVSYNWLKEYVKIDCGIDELAEKMTMAGIEVEAIETAKLIPDGIVVGEILERNQHPNADKLSVCKVFDGKDELQIVCGAPNCDAGKKVPLATIGTVFVDPESGKEFKIKKGKLRGEKSFGMLCSSDELGLDGDHSGLMELDAEHPAGTPLGEIFAGDTVFDVEITPNRPDWLSHWGVARDVSCLFSKAAEMPEFSVSIPASPENNDKLVTVEDRELCPRYTARIIRNVKIDESPEWLKERLLSIGLRPINNIVDITNFVLHELGQPLHAFDLDLLAENRIVVRRAAEKEKITLLDGTELELQNRHLVIADAEKPMCLAGVMGGLDSGVTDSTVNILLESAAFSTANIRATSRELGVSSDSSYRFERGIDWDMVETASDRAVSMILEMAGGKLVTDLADVQGQRPEPAPVSCGFENIRKLIGVEIENAEIVDIFSRLGLTVSEVTPEKCVVVPPQFRLDVQREADLAEEVARIHGLDQVPVLPVVGKNAASIADDSYLDYENLQNDLISLGLYQCLHYSMVNEDSALRDTRFNSDDLIKIDNPLSLDLACMRPSLFGEMLDTVERNVSRKNTTMRLFEMGSVFCGNSKLFPEERVEICMILSGQRRPERFSDELKETFDFYDIKGMVEALLERRDIVNYKFEKAVDGRFAPGQCAALLIDGKVAGHLGMLAPEFTKGLRTEFPIFAAQLEAENLLEGKTGNIYYKPVGQYPSTTRDVAFIADNSLEHQKVIDFIASARVKNLEKVEIFDIFYNKETLGVDKKSMAYTLTFRNPERTLTDKEVNGAFEKLRSRMAAQLDIELR